MTHLQCHAEVGAVIRLRRIAASHAARALAQFENAQAPVTAVSLSRAIGVSERTAFRLIGRFTRAGLIARTGGGWVLKRERAAA